MGLTSALFTGLSGMKSNEFRMDVIGDNIANVNTYAYKSSRVTFQNQFLNTLSFGSTPDGSFGGANPLQVGTGVSVGAVSRSFAGGAPETTGRKTDMAVLGEGLFILTKADGNQVYTRDGSFHFNAENYLVSADGHFLQGYGVDDNFNIIEGALSKLRVPLGEISTATATSKAQFTGTLNGGGVAATTDARPVLTLNTALTSGGGFAGAATALTALDDGAGNTLFHDGNVITMAGATKGGALLDERQFIVGVTGATVADFAAWLEGALGICTLADDPNLIDITGDPADMPGVRYDDATGLITIVGNIGSANNMNLSSGALVASKGSAADPPFSTTPLAFSNTVNAASEGVRTMFQAYDSLGVPVSVTLTLALESLDSTGATWRFFADSDDDTDVSRFLGTGLIRFDAQGHYAEATGLTFEVNRDGSGAQTPQSITMDFSDMKGFARSNAITLLSQDGFPSGTLQDFSIAPDGKIIGSFTNGQSKNLGQVVLCTFRNYEGLIADGGNLYRTGPNSGDAIIKRPQDLGAGQISAGALELSNVDLSREFINLIVSSTGFSAASRVIQTSDRLLSELMMLGR